MVISCEFIKVVWRGAGGGGCGGHNETGLGEDVDGGQDGQCLQRRTIRAATIQQDDLTGQEIYIRSMNVCALVCLCVY